MQEQKSIVDGIYEAAILPDFWTKVIESIAEYTGCYGGSLFSMGSGGVMMTASRNCEPHLQALHEGGWAPRNIRAQRLVSMARNGFVTDHDLCTQHEIDTHEIFTQFLRPRGLGWGIGTHIVGAEGDVAVFSLDQSYDCGPVSEAVRVFLDEIRPHIARAAMLASQFRMERIKGSLSGLELVGIAGATVSRTGKVGLVNHRFQAFQEQISAGAFDILSVNDGPANALLKQALDQLHIQGVPRSIPVLQQGDKTPFVVHIIPIERQARDIFTRADAIVAIVPLNFPGLPFKALAQSLYDLTHAETRVTEALLVGESVQSIAEKFGLSVETIRTHVKNILSKTGTARQAELISRFSSFKLPVQPVDVT